INDRWSGIRFCIPDGSDLCDLRCLQDHYQVFSRPRSTCSTDCESSGGAVCSGRRSAALRYLGGSEGISLTPQEVRQIRIFIPLTIRPNRTYKTQIILTASLW